MNNGEKVLMDSNLLKKIKSGLQQIRIRVADEELKGEVDKILQLLDNNDNDEIKFESLEDTIHNKMKTTKDKDLNVKLYMLYRKLQDGKISESEALKLYEIYVKDEYKYGYL
ncbi:hypothetical protein CLTEP_10190 [Clostridium tepidiprofundi DSM 19306]|uniref:EF-hand domain-containing protein n=1 Tax=Clostridium tepidiprofundi DSM 19306 TaxID=1121338 RepID=A0A151B564_9CLOT|nr:hypothetical protein [Clostridium tepidiprofundi]KYH35026.1 hypothetical protein CLTEP_10190 [Clostridium tepidiprofundi DSM 19306]